MQSVGPGADAGVQTVSPQVTISHLPGGRLPLLFARHAVTLPSAEHHRPLAGTQLYCLVTEAHRWRLGVNSLPKVVTQLRLEYRIWTHDLLIANPTIYPLCHRTTWVTPNCPKPPHFHIFIAFYIFVVNGFRNFIFADRLIVASPSPSITNHPWKGRGEVTWTI